MKSLIRFMRSTNGVFVPKSPMDDPEFAKMYASIFDTSNESIKRSLRGDMAAFGSDFKKATQMAKEMLNVE